VTYAAGESYADMRIGGVKTDALTSVLGPSTRAVRINGQWLVPVREEVEHAFYESQLCAIKGKDYAHSPWRPARGMFDAAPVEAKAPDIFGYERPPA